MLFDESKIYYYLTDRIGFLLHIVKVYSWHLYFLFYFFFFLGPHPWHMEVPRLGVKVELQMPAYSTATTTPDLIASVTYTTAHGNAASWTQ